MNIWRNVQQEDIMGVFIFIDLIPSIQFGFCGVCVCVCACVCACVCKHIIQYTYIFFWANVVCMCVWVCMYAYKCVHWRELTMCM